MIRAVTVALLVSGCGLLFPEREPEAPPPATSEPVPDPTGGGAPGAILPYGYVCAPDGSLGSCVDSGATCQSAGGPQNLHLCLIGCDTQTDCPALTRCSATPEGRFCLRQCPEPSTCAGVDSRLLCIPTGADAVCWLEENQGGELIAAPDPLIARVDLRRCAQPAPGCGEPGLPQPGSAVSMTIEVTNAGARSLSDATITLVALSPAVSQLSGETAKVGSLAGWGGSGVVSAAFAVSAAAKPGDALPFSVRVVGDGPGEQWMLPIDLRLYGSTALAQVTETELVVGGQPAQAAVRGGVTLIRLYAQNLGFEPANGVQLAITPPGGAQWLPMAAAPANLTSTASGVPGAPQLVAQGELVLPPDFGEAQATLQLTLTDQSGAAWPQTLTLPVSP